MPIRSLWQVQNRWRIALLFMHTISIAQWAVKKLFHRLEGFMEGGSPQIYLVHSRVNLVAVTGKSSLNLFFKNCPGSSLQPGLCW